MNNEGFYGTEGYYPGMLLDQQMADLTAQGLLPQDTAGGGSSSPPAPSGADPAASPAAGGSGPSLADYLYAFGAVQGNPTGGSIPLEFNNFTAPSGVPDPNVQAAQSAFRAYDPNANLRWVPPTTNSEGSSTPGYWTADVDMSKLPRPRGPQGEQVPLPPERIAELQRYGIDPASVWESPFAPTSTARNGLFDENATWNDPVWGQLTFPKNIRPDTSFDWLSLAPALVSAIPSLGASFAIPGMVAPTLGQAALMGGFNATAGSVGAGRFDPLGVGLAAAAPFFGPLGRAARGAYQGYQLSQAMGQPAQVPRGTYNPGAYGQSMGATGGTGSVQQSEVTTDTKPVADAFAGDVYGTGKP